MATVTKENSINHLGCQGKFVLASHPCSCALYTAPFVFLPSNGVHPLGNKKLSNENKTKFE